MMKTLGLIHVRADEQSAELKIARKLGGMSLLEHVVRRATDCERLDGVVVLAPHSHEDRIRPLVPLDVAVLSQTTQDCLSSVVSVLDAFEAVSVVRLAADNPFVDPVLVDRLVSTADAHPACDYISYCSADGRPAILSPLGVLAEWCGGAALRRAAAQARRSSDRELVSSYLYAHPELFNLRLIPLPVELDRDDLRLKIDLEEDWEHAQAIYDAVGPDASDWQTIADLLDHQPALRKRMAMLNRAAVPA